MKFAGALPIHAILVALGCLLAAGCGSKFGAEVSGVVTNNGQPLNLGTVAFHPVTSGTTAYGAIKSDGSYTVKTGKKKGLPPGEYIVTVMAREPNNERTKGGGPPKPGKLLTPQKYTQKDTTKLRYTVTKGKNEFAIDLVPEKR